LEGSVNLHETEICSFIMFLPSLVACLRDVVFFLNWSARIFLGIRTQDFLSFYCFFHNFDMITKERPISYEFYQISINEPIVQKKENLIIIMIEMNLTIKYRNVQN